MQIERILLVLLLWASGLLAEAQQLGSIRGKLKLKSGDAAPALTIKLESTAQIAISDNAGEFVIKSVAPGSHTLLITGIGYQPAKRTVTVTAGQEAVVALTVEEASIDMDEVTVVGRTETQEVNRQAYNVTAIDAKKLYNTTLDLAGALDRVAGVRVRESGGVGSSFNLSINGFAGNQVRYFIDGIPMEGFGSAFQINNIPVNTAERVEVYKGVVPIWLGSDALGGAVNIVTGNRLRNYVDVSYSYGSFNTHRTTVNTAVTSKSGLTAQISAFQNYSDNSYKVRVDVADINTGAYAPNTWVRRFHDTYHNETLIANVGVVNKPYADKLLLGVTLGKSYQEIQTGARLVSVFGRWYHNGTTVMPTLKYKKDNLVQGLNVALNANFNFGTEQNVDTAFVYYDWYGNLKRRGNKGGERNYTLYKFRNNVGVATATASYRLSEHQNLSINDAFNAFDRQGSDAVNPSAVYAPQQLQKNVLGVGYTYSVEEAWSVQVFGKHLAQRAVSAASDAPGARTSLLSYGLAGTYFLSPVLQLKGSYERASRLPDAYELFGDAINQVGNTSLRPEQSHNANLGASYTLAFNADDRLEVMGSAAYRYASNFIYRRLNQNQTAYVLDNRDGVRSIGGDGSVRFLHKNRFSVGAALTYQYVQNLQQVEPGYSGISPLYKDQMPNIPDLFGNADASLQFPGLGSKNNNLTLGANLFYMRRFWLYWPSLGGRGADEKLYYVPQQLSCDLNVVYSLQNGRYNIGLEARDIADALLYDNFSLQKPGRAFYLNLRYFFSKTNTQ
jgi:outer membrane receptor protein involved in Fe transport